MLPFNHVLLNSRQQHIHALKTKRHTVVTLQGCHLASKNLFKKKKRVHSSRNEFMDL